MIDERFFLSAFVDLVPGMTTLLKLEMFILPMLMSSFISVVFFSNKRCFFTYIT